MILSWMEIHVGNKKLKKKISSGGGTIFAWFSDDLAGLIVSKK